MVCHSFFLAFDSKENKAKLGSDHFFLNSKESLSSKSWPWKLEIERGGKEQSGLVWPIESRLFVAPFYWLAGDSVIANIISSRLKDVQTRLNWKLES